MKEVKEGCKLSENIFSEIIITGDIKVGCLWECGSGLMMFDLSRVVGD